MSSECSVVNPPNRVHSHRSSRKRRVQLISRKLHRAAHVMGPTLLALTFAGVSSGVAHAQGTMDFSGAQTLMGTFKTFCILCGCCYLLRRTDFRRNPHDVREISGRYPWTFRRSVRCRSARLGSGLDRQLNRSTDVNRRHL